MNLVRSAATVSGLTLLSRITGLVRENLTASIFGASALTDAFFVAFRLPNLLRRMFAEGAFSQAFVPILAAARERGDESTTRQLVDHVATVLFWALVAVSAAGVVGAPVLVWAMASGLAADPAVFESAVVMTRWMFPYILLISMVALAAGILNTWRQFAVPAFTPVLLNLSFIGAALGLSSRIDPPIYALAVGVVAGGVAQLAWQVPALLRIGMLPRIGGSLRVALADPQVRRILKQMGPAVLAVSVAQISLIVNTHIASRLGAGSVSWISFGDRLMEFPTALLGVAMGTVLLPSLSRAHAAHRADEYSALLDWGLRLAALLSLPCMVGLALMSTPLTALLFHYGRFDANDLEMTQRTVLAYSAGLIGLVCVKILAPGFYGKQDVRTPFKIALVVLAATQLLNCAVRALFCARRTGPVDLGGGTDQRRAVAVRAAPARHLRSEAGLARLRLAPAGGAGRDGGRARAGHGRSSTGWPCSASRWCARPRHRHRGRGRRGVPGHAGRAGHSSAAIPQEDRRLMAMHILFVGGGNMASALIGGLLARGTPAAAITVIEPSADQRGALARRFGVAVHADPGSVATRTDVVILAVKPQQMREAVQALRPVLSGQLVVSVAAGVRAADLSRWLGGHRRIVRAMPNTPALIGQGATGLAALPGTADADRQQADAHHAGGRRHGLGR